MPQNKPLMPHNAHKYSGIPSNPEKMELWVDILKHAIA